MTITINKHIEHLTLHTIEHTHAGGVTYTPVHSFTTLAEAIISQTSWDHKPPPFGRRNNPRPAHELVFVEAAKAYLEALDAAAARALTTQKQMESNRLESQELIVDELIEHLEAVGLPVITFK